MTMHELLHPDMNVTLARDVGKLAVEAHRRLTQPLTVLSFTLAALVSVLTGAFSRHGSIWRPAAAVGALVALLALGLAVASLATRDMALIPLIWAEAILPGVVCAWALFRPPPRAQAVLSAAAGAA
jgi:lipopolysaccharide export system permease protein